LSVNAAGNELRLETRFNGGVVLNVSGTVSWAAGQWYQVVVAYSPEASVLYVNGEAIAAGTGISVYPPLAARALYGFSVGSNRNGAEQAKGEFEELETFNYALSAEAVEKSYNAFRSPGVPVVSVERDHVRDVQLRLAVSVPGGATVAMAILVNSEDFENATWGMFQPTPTVSLGPADGIYRVWIGVRGFDDYSTAWDRTKVVLDRVPPTILGVSPTNNATLVDHYLELSGYAEEHLDSVRCDLYNSAGGVLERSGSIRLGEFDDETFIYRRTDFDFAGLLLAEGTNAVVVRATDLAGNEQTLTLNYTLDYSADQTPPNLAISWPGPGARISGSEFAVSGTVNEPSAAVRAVISANGTEEAVEGTVSPSGQFYVERVPLADGLNTLTVYAKDPAGHESQQQVSVERSSLSLTVAPVSIPAGARQVTISGTVGDPGQVVTVNGVSAVVEPGGAWTAYDVPVATDEVAFFLAAAAPPGQPGAVNAAAPALGEQQPYQYVQTFHLYFTQKTTDPEYHYANITKEFTWDGDVKDIANSSGSGCRVGDWPNVGRREWQMSWPKGQKKGVEKYYLNGELISSTEVERPPLDGWELTQEQCGVTFNTLRGPYKYECTRSVTSRLYVFTGSRLQSRKKLGLVLTAGANDFSPYYQEYANSLVHLMPSGYEYPGDSDPLGSAELRLCREELDWNYKLLRLMKANSRKDATPEPRTACKWIEYFLTPEWPPLYAMTRAKHPNAAAFPLQAQFDVAAERFGIDDDAKLAPAPSNYDDDVPYYADFYIRNDQSPKPFPSWLEHDKYNRISEENNALAIHTWGGAHIKQVSWLYRVGNTEVGGQAIPWTLDDPTIILGYKGAKAAAVVAHEWGHTRGLADVADGRGQEAIMSGWLNIVEVDGSELWPNTKKINQIEAAILFQHQNQRPPWP
jgi:hypothetical protein